MQNYLQLLKYMVLVICGKMPLAEIFILYIYIYSKFKEITKNKKGFKFGMAYWMFF